MPKLRADIYDTLELVSLIHGGVGHSLFNVSADTPACSTGLLFWAKGQPEHESPRDEDIIALEEVTGYYGKKSDEVVRRYLKLPYPECAGGFTPGRMPFAKWIKAMQIEREDN